MEREQSQIKIEVNNVFRGTILPVKQHRLVATTRDLFTTELSALVLATAEIYGSKLVAALDPQHPRDFFDVRGLYGVGGLTSDVMECFVCYMAGHNRPVHEVLFSRDQDMTQAFENEFVGMTRDPGTLDELIAVRQRLKSDLPSKLTE